MCYYAYLYVVLGIKPRASCMPGKLSITQATLVLGAETRTHNHALQTDKALAWSLTCTAALAGFPEALLPRPAS